MSRPAPVGGPDAQERAREELSRPEYRHGGDRHLPGWLRDAADWVARQLGKLFDALSGGGGAGGHAVLLVVLVLLAVVVLFAVRAGLPQRRMRSRAGADADPLAPTDARAHRALAAEHEAAQRYAEALREWLRATIATIEERGLLTPRPGRTGVTTALETAPLLPAAAGPLHAAVRAFDEVWYGGRAAGAADAALGRAAADAVAEGRPRSTADAAADAMSAASWQAPR